MTKTGKKFNLKDVNWKELLNRTVKPAIAYSIVLGAGALAVLIGVLCVCL